MNIIVADYSGFCFGVERAIKIVEETYEKGGRVYTLGPIIHNPQLVKKLEEKGVKVKKGIEDVEEGDVVVIRSHGIPKQNMDILKEKKIGIVDATCPFVARAQRQAEILSSSGYFLVVFGEKDHPEVKGIVSYSNNGFVVVENSEEVEKYIKFHDKIGVVAQTTQSKANFDKVIDALKLKCNELKVVNTICNATYHRQEAAKKVALISDIMYVIGGKNSGNTRRLYEICKEICPKVFYIETKNEIDKSDLVGVENVGITAGASTPKFLIDEVIEFLKEVENAG